MTNPFEMKPVEGEDIKEVVPKDLYYNEVDNHGNVIKYKIESGIPVKVGDLGNIKDFFQRAINRASLMTPDQLEEIDLGDMTHIEIAAIKIAAYAAAGDFKCAQELFDRVMGKSKQISESTNLNLSIDDILNGVQAKKGGDVVDV